MKETGKKDWPVFSSQELVIGNLRSSVGICILWSKQESFVGKYLNGKMDKISVVGNLYSTYGVGILVRNYLANPNLRYLVVTGTELGNSKKALENLGTDVSMPQKLFLKKNHINRFLNQVSIIYTDPKNLDYTIKQIEKRGSKCFESHKFKPIIVSLPEPKATSFPSPCSGHLIRVRTIQEGYEKLLREIRFFGHITGQDSEGQMRQELWELNMVITSQEPCDFSSIPHPEYDEKQVREYCENFWFGTERGDLAYRYGDIIRHSYGDQVKAIEQAFKDKAETFRTVISLWDPKNSIAEKDPPCIVLIHLRIIGNFLHLWAYIRTNDMFGGWPINAAALRYFQYRLMEELKIVLERPNLQLGELGITSGSAHIYERNWLSVDSFLGEEKVGRFYPDPKGNFEIKIVGDEIIVNHYSPSGGELLQIFKGGKAEELSKQIAPFVSEIKNALYIGRELQKAEKRLKNGNKDQKDQKDQRHSLRKVCKLSSKGN